MAGSGDLLGLQARKRSLHELPPVTARAAVEAAPVMREARKSEPAARAGQGTAAPARAARMSTAAALVGTENVAPGTGAAASVLAARRPRFGGQGLAASSRLGLRGTAASGTAAAGVSPPGPGPLASGRLGATLGDITNVVHAGRGLTKPCKPLGFSQQQQPPLPAAAAAAAHAPAPPAAAPIVAAVLSAIPPFPIPSLSEKSFNAVFEGDAKDPQRVSDYAADIFGQLFRDEAALLPSPDYMEGQTDINVKMRAILVDWLVEVHMKYRLRPETLFLTVNIIDRYLSLRPVMRKRLQLLGVVAMFIAAKFEEIDPPKVGEFVYITDNTYTKTDILSMECTVLVALNFQIAVPTPAHFLDRLLRVAGCEGQRRWLAQYALELALLDFRMLRHPPSVLVGAALLLSSELLGQQPAWPAAMASHARRPEAALRPCAEELRTLLETAPRAQLQAVRRKYQHERHSAVASLDFLKTPR